jgi:hypothetical protein
MDSATALATLLNDPENFLKYYPIKCAGSPAPLPNAVNYNQYNINKSGGDLPIMQGEVVGHRGARKGLNRPKADVREFKLSDYIERKIIMRAN